MNEETREAFEHTWERKTNRDANEQDLAMRQAVQDHEWSVETRQLDMYTEATIYRDVTHNREPYLAAWMIIPGDPHPWWCARFAPGEA